MGLKEDKAERNRDSEKECVYQIENRGGERKREGEREMTCFRAVFVPVSVLVPYPGSRIFIINSHFQSMFIILCL